MSRSLTYASVSLCLFLFTSQATAAPIAVIDQQNPPGSTPITTPFRAGQSFTPTLTGVDAVEFDLRYDGGGSGLGFVEILSGVIGTEGLGGTVLGTSITTAISPTFAVHHFDFPSTVALTPSSSYVAVFNPVTFGNYEFRGSGGTYPGGQFLARHTPSSALSHLDVAFTEGTHVPEPSCIATITLGLVLLSFGCDRRRKESKRRSAHGRPANARAT